MQKNTRQSGMLLLLLARQADSLCSAIQSWAIARRWGDLLLCHSVYDLLTRLDDIAPQQPVILIGRSAMLTAPFLKAVLRKHPALRLINWSITDPPAGGQMESSIADLPIVTVSNTEQLANVIRAFEPPFVCEKVNHIPDDTPSANAKFDPKDYRLSNDEINALLGDG